MNANPAVAGQTMIGQDWHDRSWQSEDGLSLHYRDYSGPDGADLLPVICIPGLTRNARDFAGLASHLSQHRRVICVDLRGRGDSDFAKDAATYQPLQYAQDVIALMDQAGLDRAAFIGSSLGGLVTMTIAMSRPALIAGAVLNDVGPKIEKAGLERIADYVGQQRSFPTWMHAARSLQENHGAIHPDWGVIDWLAEAKRVMVLGNNGRITFDYDMRIGEGFADAVDEAAGLDLWPAFETMARYPLVVVRGENSDILSDTVAREMQGRMSNIELVTVPGTGHLPTLAEPEVMQAIEHLLNERLIEQPLSSGRAGG
ncbi:alpha/beta fold hydrolase [Croceicoccus naphthovorans]|nr:alpha/beta hydrolase [Croceicoccus naphthovorans]MBB3988732.1 pimeloyl-ACP methyl ester carboxylesterase [Croceicoccus naphthovorans]